jgi:hypothetical protein
MDFPTSIARTPMALPGWPRIPCRDSSVGRCRRTAGCRSATKALRPPLTNIVNNTTNVLGDAGDPVLGWDTNAGIVYLLGNPKRPSIYYPDGTNNPAKLYVPLWRSTNNGETFLAPVDALSIPALQTGTDFFDKPAMVVDNWPGTGQGDVHIAIRAETNGVRRLLFNRAEVGGTNWSAGLIKAIGGVDARRPAFAVRTNHDVGLIWMEANNIMFAKSINRGTNFSAVSNVVTLNQSGFELKRHATAAQRDFFNAAVIPAFAANAANDDFYVVYHDEVSICAGKPNIYFVQSTNAGTNWDSPIQVNIDTNAISTDQWQPSITVKPDGTKLFIAWYDRRNDTTSNSLIQIYGCFASIPITTNSFSNNFLISTAQFPPIHSGTNTNANTFDPVYPPIYPSDHPNYCGTFAGNYARHMGDYDTAVSDNSVVYYSWMDGRNTCTNNGVIRNQADIRQVRISWPP